MHAQYFHKNNIKHCIYTVHTCTHIITHNVSIHTKHAITYAMIVCGMGNNHLPQTHTHMHILAPYTYTKLYNNAIESAPGYL